MIKSPCTRHCGAIWITSVSDVEEQFVKLEYGAVAMTKKKQRIVSESRIRLKRLQKLRDQGLSDDQKLNYKCVLCQNQKSRKGQVISID